MEIIKVSKLSTASFAGLLEKIELMRSTLRWSSHLDKQDIQKLLVQCSKLNDDVMLISRKERIKENIKESAKKPDLTATQRKQGLLDRGLIFEGVFGESRKLLETLEIAEKAAPTELPILIDGESGTGKELMAKVIHNNSDRSDKAFISVNCGAIPENLIESELFGHKKGAFTGASSDRVGKFESANGGTIFLDEIGELPLQGQVKLLRVLQSQEIQRVGSEQITTVDTRIVAATNQDLFEMANIGTFREDLFYRLSVIHVSLPPLRERKDEIPLLLEFYCDEAAEKLNRSPVIISKRLMNFFRSYDYPGNIRELRNIIYRISCLANATADMEHLPGLARNKRKPSSHEKVEEEIPVNLNLSLNEYKKISSDKAEKEYIEEVLINSNGNIAQYARESGMNRSHLQRILKKHGLHSLDFRTKK
jgi:transcriptional regulator with GAF, ATPase, and Fis domain